MVVWTFTGLQYLLRRESTSADPVPHIMALKPIRNLSDPQISQTQSSVEFPERNKIGEKFRSIVVKMNVIFLQCLSICLIALSALELFNSLLLIAISDPYLHYNPLIKALTFVSVSPNTITALKSNLFVRHWQQWSPTTTRGAVSIAHHHWHSSGSYNHWPQRSITERY